MTDNYVPVIAPSFSVTMAEYVGRSRRVSIHDSPTLGFYSRALPTELPWLLVYLTMFLVSVTSNSVSIRNLIPNSLL